MISEVKEVREFNINIPILDLKLICTLFFFTKAPEMDFILNKISKFVPPEFNNLSYAIFLFIKAGETNLIFFT